MSFEVFSFEFWEFFLWVFLNIQTKSLVYIPHDWLVRACFLNAGIEAEGKWKVSMGHLHIPAICWLIFSPLPLYNKVVALRFAAFPTITIHNYAPYSLLITCDRCVSIFSPHIDISVTISNSWPKRWKLVSPVILWHATPNDGHVLWQSKRQPIFEHMWRSFYGGLNKTLLPSFDKLV